MRARIATVAIVLAACGGEPPRLADTAAAKVDSSRESAPTARAGDSLPPGVTTRTIAPSTGEYSINVGGVGRVRLNFTLDEVRRALPGATFKRTSDGDGLALVEVTMGRDTAVVIYAGEDDADAAIDWAKRVERIEVFSTAFHTGEGVRPGALVADVEKIYGKVTEISVSEIESREYVEFDTQPSSLTFRLNYTGIFARGSRRTTRYETSAKILSIAVARP
jgi:hypothetical protein